MIELATTSDLMTEAPWYPILFLGIVSFVEIFAISLCSIFLIKKPD